MYNVLLIWHPRSRSIMLYIPQFRLGKPYLRHKYIVGAEQ